MDTGNGDRSETRKEESIRRDREVKDDEERHERELDDVIESTTLRTVAGIVAVVILLVAAILSGRFSSSALFELMIMALALIAMLVGVDLTTR